MTKKTVFTHRKIKRRLLPALGLLTLGVLPLAGCNSTEQAPSESTPPSAVPPLPPGAANSASMTSPEAAQAVAELKPTKGNKVSGTVKLTKQADGKGVRIEGDIKGLTPGEHGFHIHEKGDCSAPDASSAGGHFNPTKVAHGAPDANPHHAGDFGNITADKDGNAKVDMVDPDIAFEGENSVVGRAMIVHAKADDLKTQPTGDAGGRVSCGVIETK